jgi:hypothetical protein
MAAATNRDLPMDERPGFQSEQYAFAAHIRDPENNPAPEGIEDRRMAIYRGLFFNNVSQLLSRTFPVLFKILGTERWQRLIRDYFSTHQSHTPLFLEMPRELLKYLENERGAVEEDPAFLYELAHYEWVELVLSIDEREPPLEDVDPDGDLLQGKPEVSPLVWSLQYRFPVHTLSPDHQPAEAPETPTFLVVYRDREDQIGFLEVNAVTARLIELLVDDENPSGQAALEKIAAEIDHPRPDTVVEGGVEILKNRRDRQIILGTDKSS